MEIMLGMPQEEEIQCLLCVLPRCVCHITLCLTNLDLKLRKLEVGEKEEEPELEVLVEHQGGAEQDQEVLEKGDLGGPLECEGLTSHEEGSFPPQGPTGDPGPKEDGKPSKEQEEVPQTGVVPPDMTGSPSTGSSWKQNPNHDKAEIPNDKELDDTEIFNDYKVNTTNLMIKLREGQKHVEKVEEDRKKKKAVGLRRKENDRRKEDVRQAKNNRSVLEMMKHWSSVEEGRKTAQTGKIPLPHLIEGMR